MTNEPHDEDGDVGSGDEGILDTMRESGVGVRDPNITDSEELGFVEEAEEFDEPRNV